MLKKKKIRKQYGEIGRALLYHNIMWPKCKTIDPCLFCLTSYSEQVKNSLRITSKRLFLGPLQYPNVLDTMFW